ncbi:MAG: hypothetical protein AAGA48_13055 [Myxococcota bacterium]
MRHAVWERHAPLTKAARKVANLLGRLHLVAPAASELAPQDQAFVEAGLATFPLPTPPPTAVVDANDLLGEIAANVDDLTPRHVLADWWLAEGQPAGTFLRDQLARAERDRGDPWRAPVMGASERDWLKRAQVLYGKLAQCSLIVRGGFPESLALPEPERWSRLRAALDVASPVQHLSLIPDPRRFVRHVEVTDPHGDPALDTDEWPNLRHVSGLTTGQLLSIVRAFPQLERVGVTPFDDVPGRELRNAWLASPTLNRVDLQIQDLRDVGWLPSFAVPHLALHLQRPRRFADLGLASVLQMVPSQTQIVDLHLWRGLGLRLVRTGSAWRAVFEAMGSWHSPIRRQSPPPREGWHIDLDLLQELVQRDLVEPPSQTEPIVGLGFAATRLASLGVLDGHAIGALAWLHPQVPWPRLPPVDELRLIGIDQLSMVSLRTRPDLGTLAVLSANGVRDRAYRDANGGFERIELFHETNGWDNSQLASAFAQEGASIEACGPWRLDEWRAVNAVCQAFKVDAKAPSDVVLRRPAAVSGVGWAHRRRVAG